jgi:GT2 family glycosyltransferase
LDGSGMSGDQKIVSVIIVSWNTRAYLLQCLESLTAGARRYPQEIIVVDNASSDGSPEAVARQYPHVQLIQTGANLGFACANNIGIRHSTGRYLCLVNSDVKLFPDCITRLVDYCEQHPEVALAGPRVWGGDGQLQRSCRGFPTLWNMSCRALALDTMLPQCAWFTGYSLSHWAHDTTRSVEILSGCFWLARRQAVEQVGELDEGFFMYGEDMDWCRRFRAAGWDLMFVPEAEAIHYGGASSASAPVRFYVEMQRADLRYWKKHHSLVAYWLYRGIACLHLVLRVAGYAGRLCFAGKARAVFRHKIQRSLAGLKYLLLNRGP